MQSVKTKPKIRKMVFYHLLSSNKKDKQDLLPPLLSIVVASSKGIKRDTLLRSIVTFSIIKGEKLAIHL